MGILGFLKKKKEYELEIPPLPPLEEIRAATEKDLPMQQFPPVRDLQTVALPPPPRIEDYLTPKKPFKYLENESPQIRQDENIPQPLLFKTVEETRAFGGSGKISPETSIPAERDAELAFPLKEEPEESKKSKKELLERHFPKTPLFIKSENYKDISDAIMAIRNKLKETEQIAARLNEIKNIKDRELEKWRLELEEAQRKTALVDKTLFEDAK